MKFFASIIIPVHNQVRYTQQCLASLLRDNDRAACEIILVDNASSDGTRAYLETKSRELDRAKDYLVQFFNETNRGVAPAWNQGAQAAHGDYLAILNNDVVVTRDWLRSMCWAIENYQLALVSPFAATGALDYDLDARAGRFTERNISKLWEGQADFCAIVMPRATYELIGPFDEKFQVGGYEDTDYLYRMRKAGLRFAVSGAAFIHHFGSGTLTEFKSKGDLHVPQNREHFISKWGEDPSVRESGLATRLHRAWRRLKIRWWDRM